MSLNSNNLKGGIAPERYKMSNERNCKEMTEKERLSQFPDTLDKRIAILSEKNKNRFPEMRLFLKKYIIGHKDHPKYIRSEHGRMFDRSVGKWYEIDSSDRDWDSGLYLWELSDAVIESNPHLFVGSDYLKGRR
jgi:hypothetical protein